MSPADVDIAPGRVSVKPGAEGEAGGFKVRVACELGLVECRAESAPSPLEVGVTCELGLSEYGGVKEYGTVEGGVASELGRSEGHSADMAIMEVEIHEEGAGEVEIHVRPEGRRQVGGGATGPQVLGE